MKRTLNGLRVILSLISLAALVATTRPVSANEGHDPLEQMIAGYHLKLVLKEPAKVGSNEVLITIHNAQDEAVSGVTVEGVVAQAAHAGDPHSEGNAAAVPAQSEAMPGMDGMEGMQGMEGMEGMNGMGSMAGMPLEAASDHDQETNTVKLEAGTQPGEYEGQFLFPAAGAWEINVHFTTPEGINMASFPVEVNAGLPKAGILAGFLSVNLVTIFAAALLKRKPVAS